MLSVKSSKGRGDRVYFQTRYNNLDEEITSLCEASGLGVCITLNPEAQKLEFEVLEGVDRSANQKDRPPMIFSIDYDNVISREYVSDVSEFKNTAIVAGQGEGADRKITLVGNENTGINRYEMFVDARDIEMNQHFRTEERINWQIIPAVIRTLPKWILQNIRQNGTWVMWSLRSTGNMASI